MAIEVDIDKKLKGFSLQSKFYKGAGRFGILGASGCGKSMTLKCIAGIETPDSGRIVLNDRVLYDSNDRINLKPQKRNVGYLFQNYALFPNMTVEENIGAGLKVKKEEKAFMVEECIKRFQLKGLEKHFPWQLSGGQQQRCALARIIVYKPEVIMLDEPFSALDSYLKDMLKDQLLELLEDYKGDVLIVTHSRDEIYKFCDELVVMTEGKSLLQGKTKEVYQNPVYAEAAKLTGCKNISPIKRLSSHRLYASHWGLELETNGEIEKDIRFVGIRAHNILPLQNKVETNCMKIDIRYRSETPFEIQYTVINHDENSFNISSCEEEDNVIRWYIMKSQYKKDWNEQNTEYLKFPKDQLILLK